MHRAVLQACLPWFYCLCAACGLALLLVQYCGGSCDWRRLRRLPTGEDGAVQSLSLVLTLPVFLLLILFIVQISQIMVGIMMVNYAAFAAARAAAVWIPADVTPDSSFLDPPFEAGDGGSITLEQALNGPNDTNTSYNRSGNRQPLVLEPANVLTGNVDGWSLPSGGLATMNATNGADSLKYQKIMLAGVVPCLTISPSDKTGASLPLPSRVQNTYSALLKLYSDVDPDSASNARMPARLRNKLAYAAAFTTVDLVWQNVAHPIPDVVDGPTYNPYQHPAPEVLPWNPNEIGFRDPITVSVAHQFVLLPGIGRILAGPLQPSQSAGAPDRVAQRITRQAVGGTEIYTIRLEASATFVNEGYKSVIRYAIQP